MAHATPEQRPSRHGRTPKPTADVVVVIPACRESGSIGRVIDALPPGWVRETVVTEHCSTGYTPDVARKFGATVIHATRPGYGSACLAAIDYLDQLPAERQPRVVVFLDADFHDHPEQLPLLAGPVLDGRADLVIGSRTLKPQPSAARLPRLPWGTRLACWLIRLLVGARYTDLGPFRAVGWDVLHRLGMADPGDGWQVEMQIKAARAGLRICEVAVDYRPRVTERSLIGTIGQYLRSGHRVPAGILRYAILSR